MKIDQFIKELNAADEYIETLFLYGSCYRFAKLLQKMFGGEIYFNYHFNHAAVMIDGKLYDVTGELNEDRVWSPATQSRIKKAEKWSFSKNNLIRLKECPKCEASLCVTEEGDQIVIP